MKQPEHRRITYEEYLRLEAASDGQRFEFYDGHVVALAEPGRPHEFVITNFSSHLGAAVRREGCWYVTRGAVWSKERQQELKTDWMVICDRRDIEGAGAELKRSRYRYPSLVVEVISPGNAASEMEAKLACYSALESIDVYVIVDSQRQQIWRHARSGDALVPSPVGDVVETPFGAITWHQIYADTGVPMLWMSPLLLESLKS